MILFAPGYDPATDANLAVARRLASVSCLPLLADNASRAALLAALAGQSTPLFALAHGRPDALLGHGGAPALAAGDATSIGPRSVYAFACHTAARLGEAAARQGATWWGYTGAVTAPDVPSALLAPIVSVFRYVWEALADPAIAPAVVLDELVRRCQAAEQEIDVLVENDPALSGFTAYLCLLQIWQRLRIWRPGDATPSKYPAAPEPLLF
jgi:hypothetical protein